MMGDAERLLAPIEDQRHDQILFIVKMTDQSFKQPAAGIGIGIAAGT